MSVEVESRPAMPETGKKPSRKEKKQSRVDQKRTMNLFYKPDRTTKPATIALYTLFAVVCLLGLGKILVYDLWMETNAARQALAAAQGELDAVVQELADYNDVRERYQRYSATDEERELIDRMEVLALLDGAVGATAEMGAITISRDTVQIRFSGVTLAQTAQIVRTLESSPIVAGTEVHTASTTERESADGLVQANILIRLQKEVSE